MVFDAYGISFCSGNTSEIITFICAGLSIHNSFKIAQSHLKTEVPEGFDMDESLSSNSDSDVSLSDSVSGGSVEDAIKDDSKI